VGEAPSVDCQNEVLDKPPPGIYDYARRAGPGGRERGQAHEHSRATINRKSPDQAEQKL
jgi:hypothetical protein